MKKSNKLNVTEKYWLVFNELSEVFGDEVSFEELAQAARVLLRVSREDYVEKEYRDITHRPNYFSRDTAEMMERGSWQALANEYSDYDFEMDDIYNQKNLEKVKNFTGLSMAQ
jgi:hypothetical protein